MFRSRPRRKLKPLPPPRSRRRFRPCLEVLEDRTVPVTINPGDFLLTDADAFGGSGGIFNLGPNATQRVTVASGGSFVGPHGIIIAVNGDLLIGDIDAFGGGGGVIRVNPATGGQSVVSAGGMFIQPAGLAIDANGDILVADHQSTGNTGQIVRVNPITGAQTSETSGGSLVDPVNLVRAANGDLFIADFGGQQDPGSVIRYRTVGGQFVLSPAGLFADPSGIALEANGDILVSDEQAFGGPGGLIRVNPLTGAQFALASGGNFTTPAGITVHPNGDIFVVDRHALGGAVIKVNPVSGAQAVVTSGNGFALPLGITISTVLAYATTANNDSDDLVLRLKPGDATIIELVLNNAVVASGPLAQCQSVVIQATPGEDDRLTIDPSLNPNLIPGGIRFLDGTRTINPGDLLVADQIASSGVIRVNVQTGAQSVISSGASFNSLHSLAVSTNGDLIVSDVAAFGGSGAVFRINPATGTQTVVSQGGNFSDPFAAAIESTSNILVVDDGATNKVIRIDASSGTQSVLTSGGMLTAPQAITLLPNGDILVANTQGDGGTPGIIRVNPTTGVQTVVSSGGSFGHPLGLAVDASGDLIVADSNAFGGNGGVIRVNLSNGNQTTISSGGSFVDPTGLAIASNGDLYVADVAAFGGGGGIIRVNPNTGTQTTVASGGNFVQPDDIATANFLSFVTFTGNGTDSLTLRLAQNGTMLQLLDNGVIVAEGPLSQTNSVVIRGADGEADTLRIDYSGGVFALPGGVRFDGATGTDQVIVTFDGNFTLTNTALTLSSGLTINLTSVESAALFGGGGNNLIDATAFTGQSILLGHAGNDTLLTGAGGDIISGNDGNDSIVAGGGFDFLLGDAGSDTINAGAGDDFLMGGADNDTLDGGDGIDRQSESGAGLGTDLVTNIEQFEGGRFSFSLLGYTVAENGVTVTLTVNRTDILGGAGAVSVSFATSNGSAAAGSDYTSTSGMLDFGANETSMTITVLITDNTVAEGSETFTVTLGLPSAGTALSSPNLSTVTITDNDAAGITVTPQAGLSTTEAGGQAMFTIVLNSTPTANVTVNLTSSNTNEGTVFPSSVTFDPLNALTPVPITITGVNDTMDDGDIAYTILTAAATSLDSNYNGLNAADVGVINTDNDTAGIFVNPTTGLFTSEGGGTATFTIVLLTTPTADVTIPLNSSDTSEGTVFPSSITFTPGDALTPQFVTIFGVEDALLDGNILYSIVTGTAISGDANYSIINPADVGVINSDNETPGVTVTPTTGLTTTEAGGTATFTINLNSTPTSDVTIDLSSADTTEGTVSPSQIVFLANIAPTPQTVTITGVDDALGDGPVPFMILTTNTSSAQPAYNNLLVADVSVTNTDNEPIGVTVTPTSGLVTTEAGGQVIFNINLLSTPTANVTIDISSSDTGEGTAFPTQVVFVGGIAPTPQTVIVTGVDDALVDGAISYTIITATTVSAQAAYNNLAVDDVSVTNTDNEQPGQLQFESSGFTVAENGLMATITVTRTGGSDGTVTVNFATSAGTATAGTDYTAASGMLTFNPGVLSQTFMVPLLDDGLLEGDETVNLTLSNVTGGATLGTAFATLTIADFEAGQLQFSNASYSVTEDGGMATITVSRTNGTSGPASVDFTASDGTAVAGQDYTATSGTLMFTGGESSKTFTIPILNSDSQFEGNETITLMLSNATGAGLGSPITATLTLIDDDPMCFMGTPGPDLLDFSGFAFPVCVDGLGGDDTIIGSAFADTLMGGDGNDSITGGAGNDTITAGQGNDTVDAGLGTDTVDAGGGTDRLVAAGDADFTLTLTALTRSTGGSVAFTGVEEGSLTGGVNANIFDTSVFAGPVTLNGGASGDSLRGGTANDSLLGSDGDDTLEGGGGLDTLVAGSGDDLLDAGPGNDSLAAGSGDDTLFGNTGNDTLTSGSGNDQVDGGADTDLQIETGVQNSREDTRSNLEQVSLTGTDGDDEFDFASFAGTVTLDAGAGADTMIGGSAADMLMGGDGDDMLCGNAGNDAIMGGAGTDTLMESADVSLTLSDTQLLGLGTDTLTAIEKASLTGGGAANTLDAAAFTIGPVTLDGAGGGDMLIGGTQGDSAIGGAGNDTLCGGPGDDTLDGGSGTDRLMETADVDFILSDTLLSGLGDDSLSDINSASLTGGTGPNTLNATAFTGQVTLDGAAGNDTITTGNVAGTLMGGDGNDMLVAGAANDMLMGGLGDDLLCGELGNDVLDGGLGVDTVMETADTSFALTNTSLVGVGTDALNGVEQASLTGGVSGNTLDASAFTIPGGGVTLDGAGGNDLLTGGTGNDLLDGGAGVDALAATADADFALSDTRLMSPPLGTDTLSSIDRATLEGGGSANQFDVSGFSGLTTLMGGGGTDQLAATEDASFSLAGNQFQRIIAGEVSGTSLMDAIEGFLFTGGAGDNTLTIDCLPGFNCMPGSFNGGDGTDAIVINGNNMVLSDTGLVIVSAGNASIGLTSAETAAMIGTDANDLLDASAYTLGPVTLDGGLGPDTLRGGTQADSLIGGDSADMLFGNAGNDTLTGGDGGDNLDGGAGIDRLIETLAFNLTLSSTKSSAKLVVKNGKTLVATDVLLGIEEVHLTGNADANMMTAAAFKLGPVTLDGGAGNDKLTGTKFNDSLIGGAGADTLKGGAGNDTLDAGIDLADEIDSLDGGGGKMDQGLNLGARDKKKGIEL